MSTILPPPSPVISVLSQKGGTGKTTMVRTLADVFRRVGLDVLAVDLDPQGNLSDYFDVDPDAYPTIGEVLSGRSRAADAIHKNMIPANLGLAEAELVLSGKMGRELTLKRALHESRRQYELILIDCPPALGLLTVNALVASTHSLVSAEGEYFSLQGVEQVLEVMQLARENLNEGLEWLGVVMNIADLRTNHSRDALELAARELRRPRVPDDHPQVDPLSGVGRARRVDPRLPARARHRLRVARGRAAHAARRRGDARAPQRIPRRAGAAAGRGEPERAGSGGRAVRRRREGRADHRRGARDRRRGGAPAVREGSAGLARRDRAGAARAARAESSARARPGSRPT